MHQIGGGREGGREGEDLIVTMLRAVKEEGSITKGITRERIVRPNILYYHTHCHLINILLVSEENPHNMENP